MFTLKVKLFRKNSVTRNVSFDQRGWTTWTTAAVDKRVIGMVPTVMDLLNIQKVKYISRKKNSQRIRVTQRYVLQSDHVTHYVIMSFLYNVNMAIKGARVRIPTRVELCLMSA